MDPNLSILIIEDVPNDVLLLKLALTRAGVHDPVQVVSDGQEALDYLQGNGKFADRLQHPFPSIIFTDLKMPRMGGFEVLKWLRSHTECSVIPVIVLTASKIDSDIKQAYTMGANAYLVKPTRLEDLQDMLKAAYAFWAWCEKPVLVGRC
ncbi:MAG: response regulator receiver protein [Pedosphaera sp.]|nr:response regulator receiver protein [Pedosphaera sp.]